MKKSLVALAVLAATGAYAQSSVTLYGIIEPTLDLGYKLNANSTTQNFNPAGVAQNGANFNGPNYLNQTTVPFNTGGFQTLLNTGVSTIFGVSGTQNNTINPVTRMRDGDKQGYGSSRFGLRGTEDLGGGLKANFVLEAGININDGTSGNGNSNNNPGAATPANGLFARDAWGGLSGGFGELRLGRQTTGSFLVQLRSWADAASNGLYSPGASVGPLMGGTTRLSNAVKYISPNLGGFSGTFTFATPETTSGPNTVIPNAGNNAVTFNTSTNTKTALDLALEYANGPAYVGFGYNKRNGDFTTIVKNNGLLAPLNTIETTSGNTPITAYTLGGSYDFGVVKPFLNYTRQSADTTSSFSTVTNGAVVAPTTVGLLSRKDTALTLGVKVPLGAFTLISSYARDRISASGSDVAGPLSSNRSVSGTIKAFNIGGNYALSKRSQVQVNYGNQTYNSDESRVAFAAGATTGSATQNLNVKQTGFNVGFRHMF